MSKARTFLDQIFESLPSEEEVRSFAKQVEQELGLQSFDVYLSRGDLRLSLLVVPKGSRKEGLGTKAMEALCDFADKYGLRITLETGQKDPSMGTTSGERLKRFYSRFGFRRNKGQYKDFTIMYNMIRPAKEIK